MMRRMKTAQISIVALSLEFLALGQVNGKEPTMAHPTLYRTIQVDGLSIFYRETGPKDAPTISFVTRASDFLAAVRTAFRAAV